MNIFSSMFGYIGPSCREAMETWINVMNELAPSARKARRIQVLKMK